jgi:hypothetical protein
MKSPIPNMQDILKTNPDIARQLATAAMQQQSQGMKQAPAPPQMPQQQSASPFAGLQSFMSSMVPPPPQQTNVRPPTAIKSPIKLPKPQAPNIQRSAPAPAPAPVREMNAPQVNIDDLLKSVNAGITVTETKRVSTTPKKGGSTGKNSVSIKL